MQLKLNTLREHPSAKSAQASLKLVARAPKPYNVHVLTMIITQPNSLISDLGLKSRLNSYASNGFVCLAASCVFSLQRYDSIILRSAEDPIK